jgi:NADPH:quinone reductase-like Zn-dependent oxidoreductase
VILDTGGNASLSRLRRALAPKGTLVIVGAETGGRWLGGTDRQLRALLLSRFIDHLVSMRPDPAIGRFPTDRLLGYDLALAERADADR